MPPSPVFAPSRQASRQASFRRGLFGISALALAALVLSYGAMCFVYLLVFSPGGWTAGVVVSAVARAREGGAYYEGAGSLLGPSWPYFPLTLIVTHALAAAGLPLLSLPPLLGGATVFLLPLSSAVLSRHLGARWLPSLAVSFALHAVILPKYHTFELIAAGAFPDACVAFFLVLVCSTLGAVELPARAEGDPLARAEGDPLARAEGDPLARAEGDPLARAEGDPLARAEGDPLIERPRWPALATLGACLVAAGLSKQVGVAGVAGSFVYLLLFARARRDLIAVVAAAGIVVVAVVVALPGCFEVAVRVIAHHPRDWNRLAVVLSGLVEKQWPVVLLYAGCLRAVLSATPAVRRRFVHLHVMLVAVLVVQLLATVKEGGGGQGGSYDMELVLMLLLPVVTWAGASWLSRAPETSRAVAVALVSVVGAGVAAYVQHGIFGRRAASWKQQAEASAELARLGREGRVFAYEPEFWAVHQAGLRIATGSAAVWHYATADLLLQDPGWIEPIERAIREQRYALISPAWASLLPAAAAQRLRAEIQASYAPMPGAGWLAPRPRY
jgi:hypothetical protein